MEYIGQHIHTRGWGNLGHPKTSVKTFLINLKFCNPQDAGIKNHQKTERVDVSVGADLEILDSYDTLVSESFKFFAQIYLFCTPSPPPPPYSPLFDLVSPLSSPNVRFWSPTTLLDLLGEISYIQKIQKRYFVCKTLTNNTIL